MTMRSLWGALLAASVAVGGCGGDTQPTDAPSGAVPTADDEPTQVAQATQAPPAGVLEVGKPAPEIRAKDIAGREVDLAKLAATEPHLVIIYFFRPVQEDTVSAKLAALKTRFRDSLEVVAVGMVDDEEALREFASNLGIDYYVISKSQVADAPWLSDAQELPMTLFVHPNEERLIVRKIVGSGAARARIVKDVATNLYQQNKFGEAKDALTVAEEEGEDETEVTELRGHILTKEGKLDEAEAEFGKINAQGGLAKVSYERGDYEAALEHASQAPNDGYAQLYGGKALQRQGKIEDAQRALEAATQNTMEDWKASEAVNAQGRLIHQQGDRHRAIEMYERAVAISPYNFVALSNESAAHREDGNLDEAEQALKKAQSWGGDTDDLIAMSLQQIAREKEKANDLERLEYISQQVNDLEERLEQQREEGTAERVDPWTTRPLIVAFLPTETPTDVFFERAGLDTVVRREIEARIAADERVRVVERELLEQLLSELDLGSSELADKQTQLELGKVLSARMLGFIDFVSPGNDNAMYPRLTNSETTEQIHLQPKVIEDSSDISSIVEETVNEILAKVVDDQPLQGLIGDASNPEEVLINLGEVHGAEPGMRFMAVKEGEPRVVGGRTIGYKMEKLGELEVIRVEDDFGFAKITEKRDDAEWPTDTKIKEIPADEDNA